VALVFWKDSLDFNRIIRKQMDHVESKGAAGASGSPDRMRSTAYKKAAEEAISQYRGNQGSRSAFGSIGGVNGGGPVLGGPNIGYNGHFNNQTPGGATPGMNPFSGFR
jgi:hypothetical protein